jgi:hypothetical protein
MIQNQNEIRRTCPEEDEILFFERCHFLDDGPQPTLEGDEAIGALPTFIVERCVADQGLNVDVTNLKSTKINERLGLVEDWILLYVKRATRVFNDHPQNS